MFLAEWVVGLEEGQPVSELPDGTADFVVFMVGRRVLDVVASHYFMVPVLLVGFPFEEIDFAEESEVQLVSEGIGRKKVAHFFS
jgi:hypothetical protein